MTRETDRLLDWERNCRARFWRRSALAVAALGALVAGAFLIAVTAASRPTSAPHPPCAQQGTPA